MGFKIEVQGGPNAQRRTQRLAGLFSDLSEAFELVHEDYVAQMESTFNAEGQPETWVELSEPYRIRKAREKPGAKILEYSGLLKSSFLGEQDTSNNADGGTRKLITDKAAVFGSTVPYALAHQFGVSERNLPARPIFQFSREDKKRWYKIVLRWAVARMKDIYPSAR